MTRNLAKAMAQPKYLYGAGLVEDKQDLRQSVLITKPVNDLDSIDQNFGQCVGQYLSEVGYKVTYERQGQTVSWRGFDIVYLSGSLLDMQKQSHQSLVNKLTKSMAGVYGKQERWHMDDDEHFKPMSFMRQLGESEVGEYTHRMRLYGQPCTAWPKHSQYKKYEQYGSRSIDVAETVYGDWWLAPDTSKLISHARLELKPTPAKYFGHAKSDRAVLLAKCGVQIEFAKDFAEYCELMGNSSATIMLNSPSHANQLTPRAAESMLMTVCLWHDSVSVDGIVPENWQVFSDKKTLAIALAKVHSMSKAQRWRCLAEQYQQLITVLDKKRYVSYSTVLGIC